MKLLFLTLLFSLNSFAVQTGPACKIWFDSEGIHKTKLFSDSSFTESPIQMSVTIEDWNNVQKNPDRSKANSPATFRIGELNIPGSVQARGASRFNLFRYRALTFLMGHDDLKVVNRNGGFKSQPKLTSTDQNARVLVEYLIYKIHEVIYKEDSVKTRLGLITYQSPEGKVLDKGYGFFLEGKGQVGKRFGMDESTSWNYPQDTAQAIPGNIFRALILDGDTGNMMNNFVYLKDKTDPKIQKRIAYDFDFSFLAPPQPVQLEQIYGRLAEYRAWLEKSYELGATSSHDYPFIRKGTQAEQEKDLANYRRQIILSAKEISNQTENILAHVQWEILPKAYQLTVRSWFEAALKETKYFVEAHQAP